MNYSFHCLRGEHHLCDGIAPDEHKTGIALCQCGCHGRSNH